MAKLKILVADSHEVVRLGISFILNCTEEYEVVGEAGTCTEVIQKVVHCDPDVVIMDTCLNDCCAIDTCRIIKEKHPRVKIIMLTSPADEDGIFDAISAGTDGLLPKQIKSEELTRAIRMVYEGKSLLDPLITSKVMDRVKNNFVHPQREEALLNPQEKRILTLIAEGKTNKEIAQTLMLSNNTIKNYVSGILGKLNFSNRAEAAVYAVRNNLMRPARIAAEGRN